VACLFNGISLPLLLRSFASSCEPFLPFLAQRAACKGASEVLAKPGETQHLCVSASPREPFPFFVTQGRKEDGKEVRFQLSLE
jgi:hypothetical protein